MRIDLNCDMGESFGAWQMGNDAALLDYVSSANLACGFHAGDPLIMSQTVKLAVAKGVAIGAHPSYPDLQGFGRRKLDMTPAEIEAMVLYQVGALAAFARASGAELTHVKPHGMLYNVAAIEPSVARAIAKGIAAFSRDLTLVCLATSPLFLEAGIEVGLQVAGEAFIDRAYNPDGTLVSRKLAGSLISDPVKATAQALTLAQRGEVLAQDDSILKLQADTLCIHGDGSTALAIAQAVRASFQEAGVIVCALKA
jgi:UPF0271 protein